VSPRSCINSDPGSRCRYTMMHHSCVFECFDGASVVDPGEDEEDTCGEAVA
jgi:hypothetical protein